MLIKNKIIGILIPLIIVLLFQAWLIKNHNVWFKDFPEQLAGINSGKFDAQNKVALNSRNEIVWYFSEWVPDWREYFD